MNNKKFFGIYVRDNKLNAERRHCMQKKNTIILRIDNAATILAADF